MTFSARRLFLVQFVIAKDWDWKIHFRDSQYVDYNCLVDHLFKKKQIYPPFLSIFNCIVV